MLSPNTTFFCEEADSKANGDSVPWTDLPDVVLNVELILVCGWITLLQ